jgi:hypothetical protein
MQEKMGLVPSPGCGRGCALRSAGAGCRRRTFCLSYGGPPPAASSAGVLLGQDAGGLPAQAGLTHSDFRVGDPRPPFTPTVTVDGCLE